MNNEEENREQNRKTRKEKDRIIPFRVFSRLSRFSLLKSFNHQQLPPLASDYRLTSSIAHWAAASPPPAPAVLSY
jgi:hypothetical protein